MVSWYEPRSLKARKSPVFRRAVEQIMDMSKVSSAAQRLAAERGLRVHSLVWEDCARSKRSSSGPNICDMTLICDEKRMPVIREPNFEDHTWDVRMDYFSLKVGNEGRGAQMSHVSLTEYLRNIQDHCTSAVRTKGLTGLLRVDGDTHVVVSSQCCLLPVPPDEEPTFGLSLYSYQSRHKNPAVLAIVCTDQGTSAQIIQAKEQRLLFNDHGIKADFKAQRLTDDRKSQQGWFQPNRNGEMTEQEKRRNMIAIIQVPLRQKTRSLPKSSNSRTWGSSSGFGCRAPVKKPDVEAAVIKAVTRTHPICEHCKVELAHTTAAEVYGSSVECAHCDQCYTRIPISQMLFHCPIHDSVTHPHGFDLCLECGRKQLQFDELAGVEGLILERDQRFPVRVTLQYYQCTSNGIVNSKIMDDIRTLIKSSLSKAEFKGSLVTDTDTDRPTDWTGKAVRDWAGLKHCCFVDDSGLKQELTASSIEPFVFTFDDLSLSEHSSVEYNLVRRLLTDAGIFSADRLQRFMDEEVSDDTLQLFGSPEELSPVLPKCGPRMRFFAALKKLKKQSEASSEETLIGFP